MRPSVAYGLAGAGLLGLSGASLLVGAGDLSPTVLLVSRLPRTVAVLLSGMALGVAAVLMQGLFRNRFVEPSTSGGVEAASLGLVLTALWVPHWPVMAKMLVAAGFAMAGSLLFLRMVGRLARQSALLVPLAGILLGGVIEAVASFIAYRHHLLQSLAAWTQGDFSGVLRGRYELLWLVLGLTALAYWAADRFTLAGLGRDFATNLGLGYRKVLALGLLIVSLITAVTVVTVGTVPFLGLIVANLVTLRWGDNLRGALPWIALSGAGLMLACDLAGRLMRFPYEIPVGVVAGVIGSALFLVLLLRGQRRLG